MLYTIAPGSTLDVRGLSPSDARAAFFSVFDRLAPGERLVLVTAVDPQGLLGSLQAERKGLFEWSPLAVDPTSWHVEVARREAALGSPRRVAEALTWDHDRLDDLERRAFTSLERGELEVARRAWRIFHNCLNRHIRFEEELLFPVFEARSGLPHAGPTSVMRSEHRQIRMILEEISRGLEGSGDLEDIRDALHCILGDHNRKEERILYPALDRLLSAAEADAVVARIQAFPA